MPEGQPHLLSRTKTAALECLRRTEALPRTRGSLHRPLRRRSIHPFARRRVPPIGRPEHRSLTRRCSGLASLAAELHIVIGLKEVGFVARGEVFAAPRNRPFARYSSES